LLRSRVVLWSAASSATTSRRASHPYDGPLELNAGPGPDDRLKLDTGTGPDDRLKLDTGPGPDDRLKLEASIDVRPTQKSGGPAAASSSAPTSVDERIRRGADLIMELCLAKGVEIEEQRDSTEIEGEAGSVKINKREVLGVKDGISEKLTILSAQQASEARACTQQYISKLLDKTLGN
jgi:hypothetical protein